MEDLKTDDSLFPPNFVTIHDLREQWFNRRQPQRQKQLETRPRSPPGNPPQRTTPRPFPPAAQKDHRKQPEQELPQREINIECEKVKASPRNVSDSRPSPANCWGVRRNASVKEGSDGRQAIDSYRPKLLEKSSPGEYAGSGADEKAESTLVNEQRKQPEQKLPRGETNIERERVKASPRNESGSRPSPANRSGVGRNTRVKEGSGGRQAIHSNSPKPSEKSSRGEYADFNPDEKAESALVNEQRKQPEQELLRGETNTERERVKASPRNESDSPPSPANRWVARCNTSVKEGSDGRQAIDSNGLKSSEKSSGGEYTGLGADEKAEYALVARVSVVAKSAEQAKKTEDSEKKMMEKNKNNNKSRGKGRSYRERVRAKGKGAKWDEGEVNEPAEEKKEKFQHASSEGQNVTPESKEVRVEVKPEEGVVHAPAKEAKQLFQRAGSESENAMPESKEVQVEVENVAVNASHVTAKAEGLNKQVRVISSKVENEGELRNLSLQYDSKKGGFQSWRSNCGGYKGYGVIEGQQRRVNRQRSDAVWVRKEDISDGHAGESSS